MKIRENKRKLTSSSILDTKTRFCHSTTKSSIYGDPNKRYRIEDTSQKPISKTGERKTKAYSPKPLLGQRGTDTLIARNPYSNERPAKTGSLLFSSVDESVSSYIKSLVNTAMAKPQSSTSTTKAPPSTSTTTASPSTSTAMARPSTSIATAQPKLIGLKNNGNQCFFNAAIQAIRSLFSDKAFQFMKKTMPASVTKNEITDAFISVKNALEDPRQKSSEIALKQEYLIEKCKTHTKDGLRPFANILSTNQQQQDTHEFMMPLIEAIGESQESKFSLETRTILTVKNIENDKKYDQTNMNLSIAKNITTGEKASLILPLQRPKKTNQKSLQDIVDYYLGDHDLDEFKINKEHFDSTQYEIKINNEEIEHSSRENLEEDILNKSQKELKFSKRDELIGDTKELQNVVLQLAMFGHDPAGEPIKLAEQANTALKSMNKTVTIPVVDKHTDEKVQVNFRVKSICLHIGNSINTGHYVNAERLNDSGTNWRIHNDETVTDVLIPYHYR